MSFAVRLDSAPPALHRRMTLALVAFALAASLVAIVLADPEQRAWVAFAALACFAFAGLRRRFGAAAGARRGSRSAGGVFTQAAPAQGSLSIDGRGRASWIGAGCAADGERPVRIERWNLLGPLAWLRLQREDSADAFDVLLVRRLGQAAADDGWRRLRAWLLWYERGTVPADAPAGRAGNDPRRGSSKAAAGRRL